MRRLLVTGSRDWIDRDLIWGALWDGLQEMAADTVLVHGDARGADRLAAETWSTWGMPVEAHPADWAQHGKRAGYVRNAEMVDAGADLCLAFILPCTKPGCPKKRPHGTHGASGCADLADKAGIPVHRIEVATP